MTLFMNRPHESRDCHCDACEKHDASLDDLKDFARPIAPSAPDTLPMGQLPFTDLYGDIL